MVLAYTIYIRLLEKEESRLSQNILAAYSTGDSVPTTTYNLSMLKELHDLTYFGSYGRLTGVTHIS